MKSTVIAFASRKTELKQNLIFCRRCQKRISTLKLSRHPSSRYCQNCERESALAHLLTQTGVTPALPLAG